MTTEGMIALLTLWVIKPLLIIAVIFLGALLLRKTSAALQHFWFATGVVAVLVLPLVSPVLPALEWQVLPALAEQDQHPLVASFYQLLAQINQPQFRLTLFAAYMLPAFWLLFYFLLGLLHLRLQTRGASPCEDQELQSLLQELRTELGVERDVNLRISHEVHSPQVWGLWHPTITLPVSAGHWSSERKLAVLIHELGHVARCDWGTMIVVKIVCALFWFLPPVWWLAARLDYYAEMACDDFIYRLRDKHLAYAESLLAFAQPQTTHTTGKLSGNDIPALPMAGHAPMFYRIQAILDSRRPRTPVAAEAQQYWVLTLIMLLLPLAALQLMPIRETLLANFLIILETNNKPRSEAEDVTQEHQTRVLDAETLRQLKQEIVSSRYPQPITPEIDQLTVVAEHPKLINDWNPDAENESLSMSLPSIRIEGYMPLETMVPVYPRNALQREIEGEVIVRFTIAADGRVQEPQILYAQPQRVFEKSVLTALHEWRYKPQVINGNPIVLQGVIETFTFQLESPDVDSRRR